MDIGYCELKGAIISLRKSIDEDRAIDQFVSSGLSYFFVQFSHIALAYSFTYYGTNILKKMDRHLLKIAIITRNHETLQVIYDWLQKLS